MSIVEPLILTISSALEAGGYPVFFLLTLIDSTVLPLPNETFMPFVGGLIQRGTFSFSTVLLLSSIGAVLGSLTSYMIGYYGTEPFVRRYGKYLRITMQDIEKTHMFFEKHGDITILISRFIPVVRQFSSLPAGAAKMNIWKFCLYTGVGSLVWNTLILYAGYGIGKYHAVIAVFLPYIEKIALIGVASALAYWLYKK
jgi:membrane protein DedA with SNARE-associated domain